MVGGTLIQLTEKVIRARYTALAVSVDICRLKFASKVHGRVFVCVLSARLLTLTLYMYTLYWETWRAEIWHHENTCGIWRTRRGGETDVTVENKSWRCLKLNHLLTDDESDSLRTWPKHQQTRQRHWERMSQSYKVAFIQHVWHLHSTKNV